MFAIAPFDQILTVDGRKLEGDVKSLAELKLYPDCLILLQVSVLCGVLSRLYHSINAKLTVMFW